MSSPLPSDLSSAQYYLLDMGREQYGDCILCVFPQATVLIDGGHATDYEGQPGCASIPDQMSQILGKAPPFDISLLVVTHCHLDHIGCLPKMVANGDIRVKWALVADEDFGYGHPDGSGPDALANADDVVKRVVAGVREEPHDHLTGGALHEFLNSAFTSEAVYKEMLETLRQHGTQVIRHGRQKDAAAESQLEQEFAAIGLKVLGPTPEQLRVCSGYVARLTEEAMVAASSLSSAEEAFSDVELYRMMVRYPSPSGATGFAGKGAVNDMSTVLKVGGADAAALFAGDMQFAEPETPGIEEMMADLLRKVNENGPYKFIKLLHHTSYNGLNQRVLGSWATTPFFGHSGGQNDRGHPDAKAMTLLRRRQPAIQFARTDHNGLIRLDAERGFEVSRGQLNDFTPNGAFSNGSEHMTAELQEQIIALRSGQTGGIVRGVLHIPFGDAEVTLTCEVQARRALAGGG